MSLTHTLRRIRHKEWRMAHRHELPSRKDILTVLLSLIALGAAMYVYHCYQWMVEGQDADAQRTRILKACQSKGQIELDYQVEQDGSVWKLGCDFTLSRAKNNS